LRTDTPDQVALRTAAVEFAKLGEPKDARDSAGQRANRKLMKAAIKLTPMTKRGYSREFKPHGDTGKRYLLDQIPAGLWSAVQAKAKREGVSLRALILKLLKSWVEG
jgi:hypothetical protein